jgi:ActR/RegA family two-component response regulator
MRSQRILLIRSDDDDTHRGLYGCLAQRGYDVFEAEDEEEGMRMAWELEPDLVIGEESVLAADRARTFDDVVRTVEMLIDVPTAAHA